MRGMNPLMALIIAGVCGLGILVLVVYAALVAGREADERELLLADPLDYAYEYLPAVEPERTVR